MSDATSPGVPPPPPPPGPGPAPASDKTAMLVLSYLGLLALVPLLVEKEDKNVLWHAKNGLVIFAAFFIAFIGLWIITMILGDRKSTRLNSSHLGISYAVFCLK